MSLAPGTALHNGHYVVDALLEAAPNGDLYWGTHVVTGMQVFIQVFPVRMESGGNDLSGLMARFEGVAFAPQSPLPNPFQLFLGDDQTLCLAMSTAVGLPWTSARHTRSPMSPKAALATIRQIAESVTWLKGQGITGLDLSPNRVWLSEQCDRITLTGLPQSHLNLAADESQPDSSVEFMARLLWSFLLGETTMNVAPKELRTTLKQKLPMLSPVIIQALCLGIQTGNSEAEPLTLQQWLDTLPDAGEAHQITPPGQLTVYQSQSTKLSPSGSRLYPALAGTAVVAAIAGISLGTFWRLNAKSLPGAIKFEPNQSFPTQAEWSGDRPEASFDTPFVPAQEDPLRRENWYDSELDSSPAPELWESPANAADWPEDTTEALNPSLETVEDDASVIDAAQEYDQPADASANDELGSPEAAPETAPSDPESGEEGFVDNPPQIDKLLEELPAAKGNTSLSDSTADFLEKRS